jgi:hypothetical protein
MSVQLNVNKFKDLMKRGTVNYAIETVKMVFTKESATTSMRGVNLISQVRVPNDILLGLKTADEIDFCFVKPTDNVLPYLEILRSEMVDTSIEDSHIELKENPYIVKISLVHPSVITAFDINHKPDINFFVEFSLTDEFLNFLSKTKNISPDIYMGSKGGFLYVRAGGPAGELNSEISLNLVETTFKEIELTFNYKSFLSMISLLNQSFVLSCAYDDDQEIGILRAENPAVTETYYLMSRI